MHRTILTKQNNSFEFSFDDNGKAQKLFQELADMSDDYFSDKSIRVKFLDMNNSEQTRINISVNIDKLLFQQNTQIDEIGIIGELHAQSLLECKLIAGFESIYRMFVQAFMQENTRKVLIEKV